MKQKKQRPTESAMSTLAGYLSQALDFVVTVYMLMVIAVMPFYYQEGYKHIGSDKSYFFRTYTTYAAKIILPLLALYLLCRLVDFLGAGRGRQPLELLRQGLKDLNFSVTDYFAMGYAVSVILSYMCTKYKETALWGTSGWYMGLIPQLFLVGIYFCISRFWTRKWVFYLFLPISFVVFLLGILHRFSFYPFPMSDSDNVQFISTIGNINWYCGYLSAVLFVGAGLFWVCPEKQRLRQGLFALSATVGFATLVTQGSDSGLFAFGVTIFVLFVISALGKNVRSRTADIRMTRFWQMILLFSFACILMFCARKIFPNRLDYIVTMTDLLTYSVLPVILAVISGIVLIVIWKGGGAVADKIFRVAAKIACIAFPLACIVFAGMIALNTLRPGSLGPLSEISVFTFGPDWGSRRGATWSAGIRCFWGQDLLHKLVGLGPDCMWDYVSSNSDEGLREAIEAVFGMYRLTNAHGEWLTILVCEGIVGAVSYAGMMLSAILRFLRRSEASRCAAVCGFCLLCYTANGIWSFQQSMGVATVFVILGIGEAYEKG